MCCWLLVVCSWLLVVCYLLLVVGCCWSGPQNSKHFFAAVSGMTSMHCRHHNRSTECKYTEYFNWKHIDPFKLSIFSPQLQSVVWFTFQIPAKLRKNTHTHKFSILILNTPHQYHNPPSHHFCLPSPWNHFLEMHRTPPPPKSSCVFLQTWATIQHPPTISRSKSFWGSLILDTIPSIFIFFLCSGSGNRSRLGLGLENPPKSWRWLPCW